MIAAQHIPQGTPLRMVPVPETERLLLRAPESRDHAAYAAFFADAEERDVPDGPPEVTFANS